MSARTRGCSYARSVDVTPAPTAALAPQRVGYAAAAGLSSLGMRNHSSG